MNNLIDNVNEFTHLLGADPEADFETHHRIRMFSKRLDSRSSTQTEFIYAFILPKRF